MPRGNIVNKKSVSHESASDFEFEPVAESSSESESQSEVEEYAEKKRKSAPLEETSTKNEYTKKYKKQYVPKNASNNIPITTEIKAEGKKFFANGEDVIKRAAKYNFNYKLKSGWVYSDTNEIITDEQVLNEIRELHKFGPVKEYNGKRIITMEAFLKRTFVFDEEGEKELSNEQKRSIIYDKAEDKLFYIGGGERKPVIYLSNNEMKRRARLGAKPKSSSEKNENSPSSSEQVMENPQELLAGLASETLVSMQPEEHLNLANMLFSHLSESQTITGTLSLYSEDPVLAYLDAHLKEIISVCGLYKQHVHNFHGGLFAQSNKAPNIQNNLRIDSPQSKI